MQSYSSDSSSDGESLNRLLDFTHQLLNTETLEMHLKECAVDEKKAAEQIETIVLNHNQLDTLPTNLYKFINLRTLDISYCGLCILPDIFKHNAITTLIAKNNNLSNESLPKTFTVNYKLRELNFSGNKFTTFPEQLLNFPNLKYLYFGSNQITTITRNIKNLKNLQILSMGGNLLIEVPDTLGDLKSLQALILCDNEIGTLPPSIANLKHLKSLLLHKNQLKTLPPEIVGLRNLTELSLRDNPLVVRFVSDMIHNPGSLLELAARTIKLVGIEVNRDDVPYTLFMYLENAHRCVNPQCKGVFFDNRVEHIKFVDFCGKYRIPLLQYLCSSKCITDEEEVERPNRSYMVKKVLLG
ncbi:hypothetical protein RN001_003045 [Aquatica leii]|uniref:Leucine-rich repeat-containing protein 58 n=1 Tax=Aquatica leii TaxID=1421715 RepID=A0AAN7Q5W2_9COLE|nr:hypothetical protein RN001_003045 [Aquatica leii]